MIQQLAFDLPARPALGREDFYVSPSNEAALAAVGNWADWPGGKLLLTGPEASGKTHLAHVWARETGARIVSASSLGGADITALVAAQYVVVEDVEKIAGQRDCEEALFHLHNLLLGDKGRLLLTSTNAPSRWSLSLPDLASRMQGTQLVQLLPPDDVLLSAVLVKLFADRQLTPPASIIPFLVTRMPRSFAGAQRVVADLDAMALSQGGPIGRKMAATVLDNLARSEA